MRPRLEYDHEGLNIVIRWLVFALSALMVSLAASAEEYRLQVGDSLDFAVAGVPLQRRITIDLDGQVSVPLIGEVEVRGRTLAEVAEHLRREIPTKSFNIRTIEGKDQVTVIEAQEIAISISEYVPVYVSGDVSHPGEQKFRPGITVRQAVSLAGGYDVVRFRVDNPTLATVDLKDEVRTKWIDFERARARQVFLRRVLGRPVDAEPASASPLPKAQRDQIAANEEEFLRAAAESYDRARKATERKIVLLGDGIQTLSEQKKTDDENLKLDTAEAARIGELFSKGTLPANRVADARRLVLLSATRSLQVGAQVESDKRNLSNAQQDLQKLIDDRREALLGDLREADDALARAKSRIDATTEKLVYTGALRSQLFGSGANAPRVSIVRRFGSSSRERDADLDAVLAPGDVVEIRLNIDLETDKAFK